MISQPTEDEIVTVHRLYLVLKDSSSEQTSNQFSKRITWLEKSAHILPSIPNNIAIVEYIGTYPGRSFHGAVKDKVNNPKFTRSKPAVIKDLKL